MTKKEQDHYLDKRRWWKPGIAPTVAEDASGFVTEVFRKKDGTILVQIPELDQQFPIDVKNTENEVERGRRQGEELARAKAAQARQAKAEAANAHPRSTYKGQMRKVKEGTLNSGQIGEVTEAYKDPEGKILLFIPDIDSVFSIPLEDTEEATAQEDALFALNKRAVAKNAQTYKRPELDATRVQEREQERERERDNALKRVEAQEELRAGLPEAERHGIGTALSGKAAEIVIITDTGHLRRSDDFQVWTIMQIRERFRNPEVDLPLFTVTQEQLKLASPFTAESKKPFKVHLEQFMANAIQGTFKEETHTANRMHVEVDYMVRTATQLMYVRPVQRDKDTVAVYYNQPVKSQYTRVYLDNAVEIKHKRDNQLDGEWTQEWEEGKVEFKKEPRSKLWEKDTFFPYLQNGVLFMGSRKNTLEDSGHRTCMLWKCTGQLITIHNFNGNGLRHNSTMGSKDVPSAYRHINKILLQAGLGGILFGEDGDYPSEAPIIADQEEVIHGILTRAFKINATTGNMEYAVQVYHEFGSQQIGAKDCKRQAANTICQLLCTDQGAPLATLRDTKVHVEKTWNLLDGLAHLRANSFEPTIYDYELKDDFQLVMELYKESQKESARLQLKF